MGEHELNIFFSIVGVEFECVSFLDDFSILFGDLDPDDLSSFSLSYFLMGDDLESFLFLFLS